jgi:hypothetical protein
VAGAWQGAGVAYVRSDLPKSGIYLEAVPLFTRGLVRLPDHARLLRELRLLERRVHRGGKDTVDHPKGGRDDHAIPRSRHNPKILWIDDAEIVGDRIT